MHCQISGAVTGLNSVSDGQIVFYFRVENLCLIRNRKLIFEEHNAMVLLSVFLALLPPCQGSAAA